MTESQKLFIDTINQKTGNKTSSYSSSSIFIWEKEWNLEIIQGENFYSVLRKCCFESSYFFPQGDEAECKNFIKGLLSEKEDLVFKYLSKKDVDFLEYNFPGSFNIQRDLDSDEYIYSIEDHINLTGKPFANCRNKLRNFSRENKLTIEKVTEQNISEALSILSDWAFSHENLHLSSYQTLINHSRELKADIFIIYRNGKPYSIQSGYSLGNGIYDLCLAQENQNIPGGGYAAKHLLMETIKNDYKFVNMEEDLGLSGLRIAKSQMAPCSKNEKWMALKK